MFDIVGETGNSNRISPLTDYHFYILPTKHRKSEADICDRHEIVSPKSARVNVVISFIITNVDTVGETGKQQIEYLANRLSLLHTATKHRRSEADICDIHEIFRSKSAGVRISSFLHY